MSCFRLMFPMQCRGRTPCSPPLSPVNTTTPSEYVHIDDMFCDPDSNTTVFIRQVQ